MGLEKDVLLRRVNIKKSFLWLSSELRMTDGLFLPDTDALLSKKKSFSFFKSQKEEVPFPFAHLFCL